MVERNGYDYEMRSRKSGLTDSIIAIQTTTVS